MNSNFLKFILLSVVLSVFVFAQSKYDDERFISYTFDPLKQDLRFFWKNDENKNFGSIENLRNYLLQHNRALLFAMNGGMYKTDLAPLGLYIENKKTLSSINTSTGTGNFYLKPNGVFYIDTNNRAFICTSDKFNNDGKVKYATQSGPMLVINGEIHTAFKEGSANLNIRNGAGILPGNKILFAMSKTEVNFYDFANYFKSKGCSNALYLDGFVSRMYLPEKQWQQTDGSFGVIIGVIK